jgi:hypothetical protein
MSERCWLLVPGCFPGRLRRRCITWRKRWPAFIARAQATGEVPADVEAEVAGTLLAAGYFAILSQWIAAEPMPFDLQSRLLKMIDIICAGLIKPEALAGP